MPSPPVAVPGQTFEEQAAIFGADERVHFSKESGTWRYEAEDGAEMEWDVSKAVWVPVVDDDLIQAQQAAYAVPGVDESTPAAPVLKRENKKRKEPLEDFTSNTASEATGITIKRTKGLKVSKNGTTETRQSKNTAVYVTGLPPDITKDELVTRFSKCGLLMEDDEGNPKVKLYADDNGGFNGEALVVYFKDDSVSLALSILDDAELRLGEPHTRMSVRVAEFGHKRQEGKEVEQPRVVDKKKATKRIVKMQKKLEEWDDTDQFGPSVDSTAETPTVNESRVVVLRHMFTLEELEKDATLLLDLKEDVREECDTLGDVTNVVLYDKEPEGIMTVKFRDPISAKACVIKMNGRFFAGRRVEASLYSGSERFQRSGEEEEDDSEGTEKRRLDDFANWLMNEGE